MESKEITFIVQGPVTTSDSLIKVLESIKLNYKDSKVVLSTWDNVEISDEISCLCDNVIQSPDPGCNVPIGYPPINVNRQLVSSRVGLETVKTKYTIKTRTDIVFTNDNLLHLSFFNESPIPGYKLGESRVIISNLNSRDHSSGLKVAFWLSDFIFFGLANDVYEMFNINNMDESVSGYFKNDIHPVYFLDKSHVSQYTPETYIAYSNFKKINKTNILHDTYYYDHELFCEYEKYLIGNFVVYNSEQLGIESLKYRFPMIGRKIRFDHHDWIMLLNKYTNRKYKLGLTYYTNLLLKELKVRFLGRKI
ncbi:WavE lipopolysaccharide synthesis family protein [Vibrio vulnificus]|uniref:WavE lipopolysaccharide synthesis family protein n=1 Tax=Vibrio vulnificus TaxID=672 RepID=UPI0019D44F0B|nr:WavE lipopolysaccharide synthesis family protein [Vibrio vulnificus]MBN8133424.1 hypothetical protein [Vibrio vulnificus]MBN8161153.1 hypothetical protein [Vibrio vulnificus]